MTNLVSFWGTKNRREREGRAKGEKKRKRKKMEEPRSSQQSMELGFLGMETNLDYEFYEIWHEYLVWYGYCLASNLGFVRISSQP